MELRRLKQLVHRGESESVEFKKKANDPLKIMKEVVAFANKSGGYLMIGVSDDGELAGLKDANEDLSVLKKTIKERCKPEIQYEMSRVSLSLKKEVLVFEIKESIKKPVFLIYNTRNGLGKPYIRVEDKSVQMSPVLRKIMKGQRKEFDQGFVYGETERKLITLLQEEHETDIDRFMEYANVSEEIASNVLIALGSSHVIEVIPHELKDKFRLMDESDEL